MASSWIFYFRYCSFRSKIPHGHTILQAYKHSAGPHALCYSEQEPTFSLLYVIRKTEYRPVSTRNMRSYAMNCTKLLICYVIGDVIIVSGQLKCDDTRVETRIRLSAKRTSQFKSAGASVQSTTGSRGVRISDSNAGYTVFRSSVRGTGYPPHSPVSPSLPLPCVTVCHHISTGVYRPFNRCL